MNNIRNSVNPSIGLGFGILAVSTGSIFVKFAQGGASSMAVATYRLLIASLLLAPIAILTQRNQLSKLRKTDLILGISAGLFLAIHFASWITSLEYTSVISSVVLVSTTPLWVALLAPITLKEPITRLVIIGMIIALGGTLIMALGNSCQVFPHFSCEGWGQIFQGKALLGNFLALVGAWAAAGYVLIGRRLREKLSLISYVFVVYGIASLVLLFFSMLSNQELSGFTPTTYLWLALLAIIPQLMGHTSFNWALGYLPASTVSIALLGEPIGSSILAFFLLNEVPTPIEGIGAILILAGIFVASQNRDNQKVSK